MTDAPRKVAPRGADEGGAAEEAWAETGHARIAAAFAGAAGRAALMPYLMGGFPDVEASVRIGEAYADNGADLVELGVPFSDPLADGPVIHAAGTRALEAGATLHHVLEVGMRVAERVPVVLMCYSNPILARGVERFADELASRRISGLIVPDLPLEEASPMLEACDAAGVALVPLTPPTTPPDRLAAIAGVESAEVRGDTVYLHARDTDPVARHLLTRTPAKDLEITSRNLEEAFLTLTGEEAGK